ncbi:MAG TPA: 30S ribosomal protein S20 [Candidatus Saccharimonadales bacterium]|nr:30S ribosomal protein S20 [Candidatus Saccharimonadales bacterium]
MPIIKSAIKRARQTVKRRSRNLVVKRAVKNDTQAVLTAIQAGDVEATTAALREAISELDRAVKKGTLHKNTAARRKSRLSKQANQVAGDAAKPKKTAAKKPAAAKATAKKPAKKTITKKPAAKKAASK